MYRLIIFPQAQKQIKDIKKQYQLPIKLALEDIKEDPNSGKPLTRELTGKFSYKVGPYRIIYTINKKDKIINIIAAGHRGIVYK